MSILVCNHLGLGERAGCFALFVFPVSHDCCVALPHCAIGLSAVCDCGSPNHTHILQFEPRLVSSQFILTHF